MQHSIRLECTSSPHRLYVSNKIQILQQEKETSMCLIVPTLGTNKKLRNPGKKRNEQLAVWLIFPPISKRWHTKPDIKTKNIHTEPRAKFTHTYTLPLNSFYESPRHHFFISIVPHHF